jgi:hypothetical protein
VRSLTHSEAVVVGLLIARSHRRLRMEPGLDVPGRSTLQTVRQRAYIRGWVQDRYIPAPAAFGLDRLVIALARPPLDRASSLVERWRSRAENVILWACDEGVLGVFLERTARGSRRLLPSLEEDDDVATQTLEVDCRRETIPVYFDYELAWARATGLPGVSSGYPRTFPGLTASPRIAPIVIPSPPQVQGLRSLVSTPTGRTGPSPSRFSFLAGGLERRAERRGWIGFRSILDPIAVATSVSGFPEWCSFVRGTLLTPARPDQLFRGLVATAIVSPFLFATDGLHVLFGVLSTGPRTRRQVERLPVLPTLQSYMQDIVVEHWPLGSTRVLTDHQYGRAIGPLE